MDIMKVPLISVRKKIILVILILSLLICVINIYSNFPTKVSKVEGFVHADGTILRDIYDKELILKGTNIGGWLVPEGWLSNMYFAGQNDDIVGKKLTYLKMVKALVSNPNIGTEQKADKLFNTHVENWFTEDDVRIIKGMGLNCIRVPFGWFNICEPNGEIKENGFLWLDNCVEWCTRNKIYLILDCHGAFGSQNKEHHSGDDTQTILFSDIECQIKTVNMWRAIAKRYKECHYIAGYDILNEPMGESGITSMTQWEFFDELYVAIRDVDPNHLIFMESCWVFQNLPNPSLFGWQNVAYQYHWYNPNTEIISMKSFVAIQDLSEKTCSYHNVPIIIGEFALGDSYEDLEYLLRYIENRQWSWLSWTYKTNTSWNWGMYCLWRERIDASIATYDEIYNSWSDTKTDFYARSDGCMNLIRYLQQSS